MKDVGGSYHSVPSDGGSFQHFNKGQRFKVGAALLCGSCLVLFLIVATSSSFPALQSTNLFSFANSMRAVTPASSAPTRAMPSIGQFPRYMNSMNKQGKFLSPSSQPLFQNVPRQARMENLVPKQGLFGFFNAGRDEKLYKKKQWSKGEKADFYSRSRSGWIPCVIADVSDQGVQVDVKPGFWIKESDQGRLLRVPYGVKGYATDKGKDLKLPPRASEKTEGLIKKQQKIEKKYFR